MLAIIHFCVLKLGHPSNQGAFPSPMLSTIERLHCDDREVIMHQTLVLRIMIMISKGGYIEPPEPPHSPHPYYAPAHARMLPQCAPSPHAYYAPAHAASVCS